MLHEDETILLLLKPSPWFIFLTSLRFILATVLLAVLAIRVFKLNDSSYILPNNIALAATLIVIARLLWALTVWTTTSISLPINEL